MKRSVPDAYAGYLSGADGSSLATSPVSLRSVVIGLLLCIVIAVGLPYGSLLIRGTRLGLSSSTPAAFFLLFLLLTMLQPVLLRLRPPWALRRGELVTVFFMMMVATAIPTRGVMGMLLPMLGGAHYYASEENRWQQTVHPYLPDWLVVSDSEAVQAFFEGGALDLANWLVPLLWWSVFFAGLYLAQLCALVILRRQWVERERLAYPLAQIPLAMVADRGRSFFANPVTWIGMAVPVFFSLFTGLSQYVAGFPSIVLQASVPFLAGTLRLSVNFLMLGFGFLIGSSVSLSLWVFYLLHLLQERIVQLAGQGSTQQVLGPWSSAGSGHLMVGALAAMVGFELWLARDHLGAVLRKALRGAPDVDDSDEILSYRMAVLGLVTGLGIMSVWLWATGLPAMVVPLFVGVAMVLFIGLARIVAETGLPTVVPAMIPAGFVLSGVGASALGPTGLVAAAWSLPWAGDFLVFMSAPMANGLRLASLMAGGRRLFTAVVLALVVALVVSCGGLLYLAHHHGGVNLHPQYFKQFAVLPAEFVTRQLTTPTLLSAAGWLWTAAGSVVMGLLFIARERLAWWPLHPVGFPVSMGWVMDVIWFSVFLAWTAKVIVLRFGGPAMYGRSKPLFLGLALGQIVAGGLWLVVDSLTGTVGNRIPMLY